MAGNRYPRGSSFSLVGYTDSDWAGDQDDRKSTSGAYQFIGMSLVNSVQEEASAFAKEFGPKEKKEDTNDGDEGDDADIDTEDDDADEDAE